MSFFKKIFRSKPIIPKKENSEQNVSLALDDTFVHNFINLGGKFLYCHKEQDVTVNIKQILDENDWDTVCFTNQKLGSFINSVNVHTNDGCSTELPFFTDCESLISENGSILFSENQLKDKKLASLTNDFIVFATTSQIVRTKGDSLTAIKLNYKRNMPANISPIKNYRDQIQDEDFLNYGTNNSKNLYLLLLEDL